MMKPELSALSGEEFMRHAGEHAKPNGEQGHLSGNARFDLSHDGLALDLGRQWQRDARHVALWGKWLFWAGTRWEPDEKLVHLTRCRDHLRTRADSLVRDTASGKISWGDDVDLEKARKLAEATAKQLRSAPVIANVIGLARSNAELIASVEQWDRDPFVISYPKKRRPT